MRIHLQKSKLLQSPCSFGAYLERWGYTAKVPRRHAKDQDPEEVRHWLEVTYPAIEARAAREDAEIHWCDETCAAADQQPRPGYSQERRPSEDRGARSPHTA